MNVVQAVHHLSEVVARLGFRKLATEGDEIEKLTAANELQNDELDLLRSLFWVDLRTLTDLVNLDDVFVLELLQDFQLGIDTLGPVSRVEELDGKSLAGRVLCDLDLA